MADRRSRSGGILLLLGSSLLALLMAEGLARSVVPIILRKPILLERYDTRPRLKEGALVKPEKTFRLLLLGDSVSYGWGVSPEETFAAILEGELNAHRATGMVFEVVNTGYPMANTNFELGVLLGLPWDLLQKIPVDGAAAQIPLTTPLPQPQQKRLPFDPDLILVQFEAGNDAYAIEDQLLDLRQAFPDGAWRHNAGAYPLPLPAGLDRFLTDHSRFYLLALRGYDVALTAVGLRNEEARVRGLYDPDAAGWRMARESLRRIGRIAALYRIPSVLAITGPGSPGSGIRHRFDDVFAIIRGAAEESGFAVVNLSTEVPWSRRDYAVSLMDHHPNAEAHAMMGKALAVFLVDRGLVPTAAR